jgi:catechol 2,3-dioxygenase-like lactoylglutathione lyase family enzyme
MRIGHIELFVRDPMASRRFYEDVLGFEVVAVQRRNLWLKLDATEILLRPGEPPRAQTYAAAGAALVLYVEDLAATAAQLRERGLQFAETDGSPKCLTFHDSDGHWFQLVNPDDH